LRPYELFVGLRYTRAKRRTHFILVLFGGIDAGHRARDRRAHYRGPGDERVREGNRARIPAPRPTSDQGLNNATWSWQAVAVAAKHHPSRVWRLRAGAGVALGGRPARRVRAASSELEDQVADFSNTCAPEAVRAATGGFGLVIGVGVARALGLHVGDKVTLISPQGR
jgi:lipoprotein-releasing system permease protein